MPPKHLEQVLVDDPKLAECLSAFGEFLTTSYFYPSGSYEKCEDSRAPQAWATAVGRKFEPYIKVSLSCCHCFRCCNTATLIFGLGSYKLTTSPAR
jgi:hypothetical protein